MWMADVEYGTADDRGGLLYVKKVCVCGGRDIYRNICYDFNWWEDESEYQYIFLHISTRDLIRSGELQQ